MGKSDGPSDGACFVHHWMDELLIKQNSASDGETTPRVQERTQPHSLGHFISLLVYMRQSGQQCFEGHPQLTVGVDTVDWFPEEELYCSGFREAPTGLCDEHRIPL